MGWPFLVAPNLGASLCCVVGAGPSKIASHRRDVDNANDYDDDFNHDMSLSTTVQRESC